MEGDQRVHFPFMQSSGDFVDEMADCIGVFAS
jgi:hypothetical protein